MILQEESRSGATVTGGVTTKQFYHAIPAPTRNAPPVHCITAVTIRDS